MTELNGKYLSDFNEVKKYIEKLSAKGAEREEAIESLLAIYAEAQENGSEISEIHEGTAKYYAEEIAESLPRKKRINKKPLFAAMGIAAAIILVAAGYFTRDALYIENGGYGFALKYPEKFEFTRTLSEKDEYIGNFTVNELSTAETDPELERFGIICENWSFFGYDGEQDDRHFEMHMVSKVKKYGAEGKMIYTPVVTLNGEEVWIHNEHGGSLESTFKGALGEIKAYLNGDLYIGEITEYNDRGTDFRYTIRFSAADENADCTGNINRLISGDYVTVDFEKIVRVAWDYKGAGNLLKEGKLPFFSSYDIVEEKEPVETVEYYAETSDGSVKVAFHTYYDKNLGGQRLHYQGIPRKLSDEVDYAITSELYLDEEGLICIDTEVHFKNGKSFSETLKTERKTELVYLTYTKNSENKDFSVSLYAERGKDGRFISVSNVGYKTFNKNVNVLTNLNNAEYEITENGDVILKIEYYIEDENTKPWSNDEEILSETIFFDHSIY